MSSPPLLSLGSVTNFIVFNSDVFCNRTAFKAFEGFKTPFMLVKSAGPENIIMSCDPPSMEKEGKGKKSILIVKTVAVTDPKGAPFPNGIDKDVVFMELNKPILDNLLAIC